MLSILSFGDKMYEYTVYAKISNREFELKTFFDSDGEPEKKAKTLIENNKDKFRSMRIEKRLVGML
jgi:ABC-type lipoprotein release transport system permease subunit